MSDTDTDGVNDRQDTGAVAADTGAGDHCHCRRCGYNWVSRKQDGEQPKACPDCKSRAWNE